VHYLSFKRPLQAPLKYVMQTVTTLRILRRERPELVLVAVPPIFAALPCGTGRAVTAPAS
jgi:UDP-N-acetylglucosamine:LPS N-acetylglucosamine transferase